MEKTKIEQVIKEIFLNRIKIDWDEMKTYRDYKLFSKEINIEVRDLIIILYDIEQYFDFIVPDNVVLKGNFSTYNKIISTVEKNTK